MFSDANLARPKVKFSTKSNKRDPDEVATRETNIAQALIALNNYRLINRWVNSGLTAGMFHWNFRPG